MFVKFSPPRSGLTYVRLRQEQVPVWNYVIQPNKLAFKGHRYFLKRASVLILNLSSLGKYFLVHFVCTLSWSNWHGPNINQIGLMPVTSLGALFDVNRLGDSSASAFKMGWFGLIFGLCFASQGLSSPFQTIFLPYTQPIYGYPWMGHRLPVIQRIEEYPPPTGSPPPLPEPVVVELETQFKCTEPGNFADPETCNWYYVCNMMSDGELRVGLLKIMLASFEMRFLFV